MSKKKPLVAVLGSGPSGLLAAHACALRGVPFSIYSKKVKSVLGGAQFSHIPIPGIHDLDYPEGTLKYRVSGDSEDYQKKVYGDTPVEFVSFDNVKDGLEVPAWSLGKMYDWLWNEYGPLVVDRELDGDLIDRMPKTFNVVFSSLPAEKVCLGRVDPGVAHWFRSTPVRIVNEALDPSLPDNTIVYNGEKSPSWYRMSRIFGVGSTEWGAFGPTPPVDNIRTVNKPTATNCDCHRNVIRIGRFGTWSKGQLTFHAYNRVVEVLREVGVE
jgi:hypothetical protein